MKFVLSTRSGRLLAFVAFLTLLSAGRLFAGQGFDVVVYGATPGGVMAAVSAARQGLSVALLEPTAHIGGMATGGLSGTDVTCTRSSGDCPSSFISAPDSTTKWTGTGNR